MGRRGPAPMSIERRLARGAYYRPSRHGPKPVDPEQAATDAAWELLKLPVTDRKLDPIEELLRQDGIEVTDADLAPRKSDRGK